ncbi:MAG: aminoglycoside phosphotransferase family protein [Micavibrio sp.]
MTVEFPSPATAPRFPSLSDEQWSALAAEAGKGKKLAGHYNDNYRFDYEGQPLLFRFPRPDEPQMDPRPFNEVPLMRLLTESGLAIQPLVYAAPSRKFSVYEFITGATLDDLTPSGSKLSEEVKSSIAAFYGAFSRLDQTGYGDLLAHDWPTKGPGLTFFEKILEKAWRIQDKYQLTHSSYYEFLGLPADPYSSFLAKGSKLRARPWQLIHTDIHRGNMVVRPDGNVVVIDWELAMYGDLLYCIAAHLHRMMYNPAERAEMAERIKNALPESYHDRYEEDLKFYLDYEALKSVITDTVRFPEIVQNKNRKETELWGLAIYYTDNLNRLAPLLGNRTAKPELALDWFREWAV